MDEEENEKILFLFIGSKLLSTCYRIVDSSVGGVVQHAGNNVCVVEYGIKIKDMPLAEEKLKILIYSGCISQECCYLFAVKYYEITKTSRTVSSSVHLHSPVSTL